MKRGCATRKKLTLTIDEQVCEALHRVIGARRISRFIENLVRPRLVQIGLRQAYREMAADNARETEAMEWAEGTCEDGDIETEGTLPKV